MRKRLHKHGCHSYYKLRKLRMLGGVATAADNGQPWKVTDLCKAYNWPTSAPGGGVIAIVELGGGWVASDMSAFFKSLGQPVPSITDVSVDSTTNSPNQGDPNDDPDIEVALDIQVAGA